VTKITEDKKLVLDSTIHDAIERIIDHVWLDEEKHFWESMDEDASNTSQQVGEEEQKLLSIKDAEECNHIFVEVVKVRRWLDSADAKRFP
jgi:hypothetical protein